MTNLTAKILYRDDNGEDHVLTYENVKMVSKSNKDNDYMWDNRKGVTIIIYGDKQDEPLSATLYTDNIIEMDIGFVPAIELVD